MPIQLNHTIIWSKDRTKSARFLATLLGLPEPDKAWHFDVVNLGNGVGLDFADAEEPIQSQHFAFLVSEADFDAIFNRIKEQGLEYWADPMRSRLGEINHADGGRGVYFPDPSDHLMEMITRPYGGGEAARHRFSMSNTFIYSDNSGSIFLIRCIKVQACPLDLSG